MQPIQDLDLYLSYAPIPSSTCPSRNHFFVKLGFKSEDDSDYMRHTFIKNMHNHVQHKSHRFLCRQANPEALDIVILEFLAEYGPVYWGRSERDHLEEPDISKGFLCPRDAERANSR